MIVSITPERVTRSEALSANVDYAFYTLRQHQEDLQKWMAMMATVRSEIYQCHQQI